MACTFTSLPSFEPFVVHGNDLDLHVGERWVRWLARFDVLSKALHVTDGAQRKAMLIHYAGEEVFDIFETFNTEQKGSEDNEGYQVLCDSLTKHFQLRKNIDFERYRFRLARQEPNESMMSFYTRLRKLAKYCEFSNLDLEIKGQIIQGCTSQAITS